MDWASVSQVVVATIPLLIAGLSVVGLAFWLSKHPDSEFRRYVPYVVQAVKLVEKSVPDATPNKSLSKADAFLKEFINIYESEEKSSPSEALLNFAKRYKEVVLLALENNKK